MSLTYTLRQLREAFQWPTNNSTLLLLDRLEKEFGFPRRLPCCSPPRWSAPAVNHWFENWDEPKAVNINVTPIENFRKMLEGKYQ